MPSLTRSFRWERFIPDLGDNREQEKPFFIEIASGLSILERKDVVDAVRVAQTSSYTEGMGPEEYLKASAPVVATALQGIVRMGSEPLTVGGKSITSLAEYLEFVLAFPGSPNWFEILKAIVDFNSADGARALFFARHSGGLSGIPDPSAEPDDDVEASP